jgi:N-acetylmuramoyl-L-alanine amidase CwlA
MGMTPSDRLVAPSRGTQAEAKAYARVGNAYVIWDVDDYIDAVYALCIPDDFPDASIVIAQSVHETDTWRSHWWERRLNPAGMGITGDPVQNLQSPDFETGEEAARAHVSHLLVYALGPADAGSLWFRRTGRSIRDDDPRYDAYVEAYGNTAQAETIAGLAGTWATDPAYAGKVCARGNAVYPDLPDQEADNTVAMPTIPVHWTPVPVGAPNNPSGMLLPGNLIIVWHENGNPASDAGDESRFLLNGGGEGRVSYHFAVDHERAFQMFALNELCYHAADGCNNPATDRGCFRGVAIEHCQDRDPARWAATKRNGAILTAMIIAGHPSIHFGGRAGNFSADRIETHQAVSDTKKNCPEWMLNEGAIPAQIRRVKALLAMNETPTTTTTAPPSTFPTTPIPAPDAISAQGHPLIINNPNRFYATVGQTIRTAPSRDAPAVSKTPIKQNRRYTFAYRTATEIEGEVWFVSDKGSWVMAKGFKV